MFMEFSEYIRHYTYLESIGFEMYHDDEKLGETSFAISAYHSFVITLKKDDVSVDICYGGEDEGGEQDE